MKKAQTTYGKRFPGLTKWMSRLEKEEGAFPLHFFRFVPTKAKIFDEKEFGEGVFITVMLGK